MTTELHDTVLAWLTRNGELPHHPIGNREPLVFGTNGDEVVWISGRPDVATFRLDLLAQASEAVGWDSGCLALPGDLRYRPLFVTGDGTGIVTRRVGP